MRRYVLFTAFAVAILLGASSALANVNGAGFTTDDPAGPAGFNGKCQNGNPAHTTPAVNCNIYLSKKDVWINGGPDNGKNHLTDGTYFFAVLVPGGQPDPNDGADKNLSDTTCAPYTCPALNGDGSSIPIGDAMTSREFTVSGGKIATYLGGGHQVDDQYNDSSTTPYLGKLLNLFPYDDTTNNGGVYILAICQLSGDQLTDPVTGTADPSECKYDAFKVRVGECTEDCGPPPAADLFGSKSATPHFTREFNWTISKGVDACAVVNGVGGCNITGTTKTLNYTVTVNHNAGSDSGWNVTGNISVTNPAQGDASNVVVTDAIVGGPTCTVSTDVNLGLNPAGDTLPAGGAASYPYSCTLSSATNGTNRAHVSWNPILSDNSVTTSSSFDADRAFTFGSPTTTIHNCIDVTDTYAGTLGTACVGDPVFPKSFTYQRTVTVPSGCVTVNNTATFTVQDLDGDADDTGSASVTAKVCRVPPQTGALTMGFWRNSNGQALITTYCGGTALRTFLLGYAPFQGLSATANCTQIAAYVAGVVNAATCGATTCNAMLKAQMLATALDVYFTGPGWTGTKIGNVKPPSNFMPHSNLGDVPIDLQNICSMIDTSTGATCSGTFYDVSAAFGGATCLTVSQMLTYAASQSNPGGSVWYGQVKATQVKAKDAFDAINNVVAFLGSC